MATALSVPCCIHRAPMLRWPPLPPAHHACDMEPYPEPPQLPPVVASAGPPAAMRNPVRLLRGVYGDIGVQDLPRWEAGARLSLARCAAACLQVKSARCLSHESAALVHGLWLREGEPDVSVVVPSSPHHPHQELPLPPGAQRLAYLRRRHLTLPQKDITTVSGLPVSTLGRTAVNCAFDLPAHDSVCVVESALRAIARPSRYQYAQSSRRVEAARHQLQAAIAAQGPRAGARRARTVVAIASAFTESPGESLLHWLVRALGLPAPRIQMAITDVHHSRLYFPDEAWPEYRVLAEFDGRIKYRAPEDLWQEKQRQDALTRMGWRIERFIWADFTHLDVLRDRILALFPATVARSARPVADLWR